MAVESARELVAKAEKARLEREQRERDLPLWRERMEATEPAPWIVCPICGFHEWTQAAVGRPRLTCSDECRQEAYSRRRARPAGPDPGTDVTRTT